jgi:hypothetical protein
MIAQGGDLERAQPLVEIDELNGVRVPIQEPTDDELTVLRQHFVEAILGLDLGCGLEQRTLDLAGAAHEPDAREIGTDTRAVAVHGVAVAALAFAFEQHATAAGVAVGRGLSTLGHGAQVLDQP